MTLLLALGACGPRAATPATAPANETSGTDDPVSEPVADPVACVGACLDELVGDDEPDDGVRGYCDELCAPIEEPNDRCVDHCITAGEPGAYYNDEGEYEQYDDERTDEEIQAHEAACEEECATIPWVSDDAIEACAHWCNPDAEEPTPSCLAQCDPDPYDECTYAPCD